MICSVATLAFLGPLLSLLHFPSPQGFFGTARLDLLLRTLIPIQQRTPNEPKQKRDKLSIDTTEFSYETLNLHFLPFLEQPQDCGKDYNLCEQWSQRFALSWFELVVRWWSSGTVRSPGRDAIEMHAI
jgi:hypothetical protein